MFRTEQNQDHQDLRVCHSVHCPPWDFRPSPPVHVTNALKQYIDAPLRTHVK